MVRIWCADDAKHSKLVEFWFHFFTRLECGFCAIFIDSSSHSAWHVMPFLLEYGFNSILDLMWR